MRPPSPSTILRLSLPRRVFVLGKTRLYSTQPSSPLVISGTIPAPHTGSIRILSLNNPRSRNAISRALLAELREHVEDIASEHSTGETRAVILASEVDEAFCAGADLRERKDMSLEETNQFLTSLRSTLNLISALPIPTLTSVSSVALGGGLELALSTTFRVFSASALVGLPETRLAIIPGAGGTYRLPTVVGRQRALEMLLTGRRVGGFEAWRLGLCDRFVGGKGTMEEEGNARGVGAGSGAFSSAREGRERTLERAVEMANEICEGGPAAVRALLRAVRNAEKGGVSEEESENREYESVLKTKDRDEALAAFREKRRPVFRGV